MRKIPAITANFNRDCDIGGVTVLFSAQIFLQVRNPSQVSYLVKKSMHDASSSKRVFPPRDSQSNGFSRPVSKIHCSPTLSGAQTSKPAIYSENLFLSKRMKEAKKLLANRQPIFTGVLSASHIRVSASAYHNNNFCFFGR